MGANANPGRIYASLLQMSREIDCRMRYVELSLPDPRDHSRNSGSSASR